MHCLKNTINHKTQLSTLSRPRNQTVWIKKLNKTAMTEHILLPAVGIYGNVRKLQFTDKHCRRFYERQPRWVEENVVVPFRFCLISGCSAISGLALGILVQHDVEGQTEGHDEEGVPQQEEEESAHHLKYQIVCKVFKLQIFRRTTMGVRTNRRIFPLLLL